MSYVDLMGDARWSEADHVERVETTLRAQVTHVREHVLIRRSLGLTFHILSQILPPGPERDLMASVGRPIAPSALPELMAAAEAFLMADDLADQARADGALLNRVLDHEQGIAPLAEDDVPGHELLAARAAARPTPEPIEAPIEEPPPEEPQAPPADGAGGEVLP